MPKLTRRMEPRGTHNGVTIVHSKLYGIHTRAPRGTHKPAILNEAMTEHGNRMRGANTPSKLINNALLPFRQNFRNSQIWSRLVAHFAKQGKEGKEYSVAGIEDWEIDINQPASKVMAIDVRVVMHKSSEQLEIIVNYAFTGRFQERAAYISDFQATVIMLFPDFINNQVITVPTVLPIKPVSDKSPYIFFIDIPSNAEEYLLCFKADPCRNGIPDLTPNHAYKVMKILRSGRIV